MNKCPECYEELNDSNGIFGKVDGERIGRFTCPVCGCKFTNVYEREEDGEYRYCMTRNVRSGSLSVVQEIEITDSYSYVEECEGFTGSERIVWKCKDTEGRPIKQILHIPGRDEYFVRNGETEPELPPATLTTYLI